MTMLKEENIGAINWFFCRKIEYHLPVDYAYSRWFRAYRMVSRRAKKRQNPLSTFNEAMQEVMVNGKAFE
jgi:hypothetical protein